MGEIVVEDRPWVQIEAEYTRDPLTKLIGGRAPVERRAQALRHTEQSKER
jgi:hypothetical protein